MEEQRRQFLRHEHNNHSEHGRATQQHDIGVQLLAGLNVTLYGVLERRVVPPDSTTLTLTSLWVPTQHTSFGKTPLAKNKLPNL